MTDKRVDRLIHYLKAHPLVWIVHEEKIRDMIEERGGLDNYPEFRANLEEFDRAMMGNKAYDRHREFARKDGLF